MSGNYAAKCIYSHSISMWKYLLEIKKHSHWHYAGVQQSLRSSVQSDMMVEKPAAGPHPPSIWVKSLAWCIMSPVWSTPRFPLSGKQCSGTLCVCVSQEPGTPSNVRAQRQSKATDQPELEQDWRMHTQSKRRSRCEACIKLAISLTHAGMTSEEYFFS